MNIFSLRHVKVETVHQDDHIKIRLIDPNSQNSLQPDSNWFRYGRHPRTASPIGGSLFRRNTIGRFNTNQYEYDTQDQKDNDRGTKKGRNNSEKVRF